MYMFVLTARAAQHVARILSCSTNVAFQSGKKVEARMKSLETVAHTTAPPFGYRCIVLYLKYLFDGQLSVFALMRGGRGARGSSRTSSARATRQ